MCKRMMEGAWHSARVTHIILTRIVHEQRIGWIAERCELNVSLPLQRSDGNSDLGTCFLFSLSTEKNRTTGIFSFTMERTVLYIGSSRVSSQNY